jgi:hypothetical protein
MGEFDQGAIEAFAIGYWGFERQCIPDNRTNRECILVSKGFDTDAIIKRAGGVLEVRLDVPGRQDPLSQGSLSNSSWY